MNILLVDDHSIVRAGIKRLLSNHADTTLHEEPTAERGLEALKGNNFNLIILDLNLPGLGGLEALRRFRRAAPSVAILIFTMHDEPIYAARSLEAGARGYISKGAPPEEILNAIETVGRGQRYVEKTIDIALRSRVEANGDFLRPLTRRDLEILRLLAEGQTLAQIATTLGIAYKTASNTCVRLRDKMGARSTIELVTALRRLDLV